jgi:hypothetical protein
MVYESALLIENGGFESWRPIVVVRVDEAQQVARLCARNQLSLDDATARIRSQMPLERKVALADYVIDNVGAPEATERRFESVYASSGSCNVPAVGQPITCTTASLSGSWQIFINVEITAPRGSTITNTANVTSSTPDPNLSNNTSSVTISVSRNHDDNDDGQQ